MLRTCRSSQGHSTAWPSLDSHAVLWPWEEWHGQGMASVNQTQLHCVNQKGKTHSKPLAARHGRGMGTACYVWIGLNSREGTSHKRWAQSARTCSMFMQTGKDGNAVKKVNWPHILVTTTNYMKWMKWHLIYVKAFVQIDIIYVNACVFCFCIVLSIFLIINLFLSQLITVYVTELFV